MVVRLAPFCAFFIGFAFLNTLIMEEFQAHDTVFHLRLGSGLLGRLRLHLLLHLGFLVCSVFSLGSCDTCANSWSILLHRLILLDMGLTGLMSRLLYLLTDNFRGSHMCHFPRFSVFSMELITYFLGNLGSHSSRDNSSLLVRFTFKLTALMLAFVMLFNHFIGYLINMFIHFLLLSFLLGKGIFLLDRNLSYFSGDLSSSLSISNRGE
jgi:hypothetical protein